MRRFFLACLLALTLTGCAGYHLGPTNGQAAGSRSVQIEPFTNKTLEPRLGDYVINSLRKSLQQDGTYRLDTHDNGDVIVGGVITAYRRNELSLQPQDVLTVLDYEVTMTVQLTARERTSGKILFDRPVKARISVRAGNDLVSSEREAIPLLAADLAKRATELLVDGSW